jgi:hypothetical protein
MTEQKCRQQASIRKAWGAAALGLAVACLLTLVACSTLESPETRDIVERVPFTAPEDLTYTLKDGNDVIGATVLSVAEGEDGTLILTQRSSDDDGNVDEASVTVEADTLKPIRGTRSITDDVQRNVAESCYQVVDENRCGDEGLDASQCDAGIVVRIEEQVFEPPDESTPSVPRRAPLCVPEHAYDNDTSLFIWRAISFEKGYSANYKTVLTGTRRIQTVRIEVIGTVAETPIGEGEAWLIDIAADGKRQRAWFSTDGQHRMLAYQNEGFTFELQE